LSAYIQYFICNSYILPYFKQHIRPNKSTIKSIDPIIYIYIYIYHQHCDESLADLLTTDLTNGILCDVGLPLMHRGVRYNCRIFLLDRKVVLVRPKLALAQDGNYREARYFTPWPKDKEVEEFQLPPLTAAACGQKTCPFGFAIIDAFGTTFGTETCEELWTPDSPHIQV
jgi:NAD+ synthase (glutamine-hydrolysing)